MHRDGKLYVDIDQRCSMGKNLWFKTGAERTLCADGCDL